VPKEAVLAQPLSTHTFFRRVRGVARRYVGGCAKTFCVLPLAPCGCFSARRLSVLLLP